MNPKFPFLLFCWCLVYAESKLKAIVYGLMYDKPNNSLLESVCVVVRNKMKTLFCGEIKYFNLLFNRHINIFSL